MQNFNFKKEFLKAKVPQRPFFSALNSAPTPPGSPKKGRWDVAPAFAHVALGGPGIDFWGLPQPGELFWVVVFPCFQDAEGCGCYARQRAQISAGSITPGRMRLAFSVTFALATPGTLFVLATECD